MQKQEYKEIPKPTLGQKLKKIFTSGGAIFFYIAAGVAAISTSISVGVYKSRKNKAIKVDAPYYNAVQEFYEETGTCTTYSSRSKDTIYKAKVPSEGIIKINIQTEHFKDEKLSSLREVVEDINEIFDNINPAYELEINENPSKEDLKNEDNIDLDILTGDYKNNTSELDQTVGIHTCGWRSTSGIVWICKDAVIKIRENHFHYRVLAHELLHHFGLGEGYQTSKSEQSPVKTIMVTESEGIGRIRKNDVAVLAGIYGDYSTLEKKTALVDYINSYEDEQLWRQEMVEASLEERQRLYDAISNRYSVEKEDINFDIVGKCFGNVTSIEKDTYTAFYNKTIDIGEEVFKNDEYVYRIADNKFLGKGFPITLNNYLEEVDGLKFYYIANSRYYPFMIGDKLFAATPYDFGSAYIKKFEGFKPCDQTFLDKVYWVENSASDSEIVNWFKENCAEKSAQKAAYKATPRIVKKFIEVPEEEIEVVY